MSRQIDLTQPLSDDDKQYLVDRADRVALEQNAAWTAGQEFTDDADGGGKHGAPPADDPQVDPATGSPLPFEDRTAVQLQEIIRKYNEAHADDAAVAKINVTGNKDELLQRITEASPAFEL